MPTAEISVRSRDIDTDFDINSRKTLSSVPGAMMMMDVDTSPSSSPGREEQPYLSFEYPPDASLPAAAELEYLTHTAFLVIRCLPIPAWMEAAHVADNFRAEIDTSHSASWAEHVQRFRTLGKLHPAHHRITHLIADVDETKAHADVFCHMEMTDVPSEVKRLGMAQLKWKRHPRDGRWQLVHIIGMREPPSDLHGDLSGVPGLF